MMQSTVAPTCEFISWALDDNQQYDIEILGEQVGWAPDSNQSVYRSGRDNKQGLWISNCDDFRSHSHHL